MHSWNPAPEMMHLPIMGYQEAKSHANALAASAAPSKSSGPLASFGKGIITGVIEASICYPTEYVKTQLQLQSRNNPEFKGMMDCGIKTIRTHGFLGLYAGSMPLIVGSSAKQAARWTAYEKVSSLFPRDENGKLSVFANATAGVAAGVSEAILAVTPMESLKTRVADDQARGTKKYRGSADALVKILKSEGPMGVYRGPLPTVLKQATNQAVRFPFQQFFLGILSGDDPKKRTNPLYTGIAGALAGGASVLVTMPQDTVKSRMQGEDAKRLYKSTFDCARQIVKNEGWSFFYTGTWPRLVRVSLDVGITFFVYPLLSKYI